MRVKNINGTSDNACKCGSWLEHWERFSNQTADKCSVIGCDSLATDGAHVQKIDGSFDWFIIPLCRSHNKQQGSLEIASSTKLVSANVSKTCGK